MEGVKVGDPVAWEQNEDVRIYGFIADLDANEEGEPDAAHVTEIGAWHRIWGHSTAKRGDKHSVLVEKLIPATATEKGIVARRHA